VNRIEGQCEQIDGANESLKGGNDPERRVAWAGKLLPSGFKEIRE
jgi:hypothetical protein